MGLTIDLNCDLGEGCGNDSAIMDHISSANIACGYHAGDRDTMRRTAEIAIEKGVAIGAHPGYRDREAFGRTEMNLRPGEIITLVTEQVASLDEIVRRLGGRLAHVKPHGALYNQAAINDATAGAIATAVASHNSELILYGLSGSASITEAERVGLRTAAEVFADRTYQNDGTLTPRSKPGAVITDAAAAAGQALDLVKYSRVRTTEGIMIAVRAQTICLHGDGTNPVPFAAAIRRALSENSIQIKTTNG